MSTFTVPPGTPVLDGPLGIKIAFIVITPDMAKLWLAERAPNRTVRRAQVERLARIFSGGGWLTTHQGFAFDTMGRLIDGQHRLEAIAAGDLPVIALVCWNLPDEVMDVIDTGTTRRPADVLTIRQTEHAKRVIGYTRALQTQLLGPGHTARVVLDATEYMKVYDWAKDVFDWALANFGANKKGFAATPVAAACMFAYPKNPSKIQEFVDKLLLRAEVSSKEAPSMLRDHLLKGKIGNTEYARSLTAALVLGAIRNYLQGTTASRLQTPKLEVVREFFVKAWEKKYGEWPLRLPAAEEEDPKEGVA